MLAVRVPLLALALIALPAAAQIPAQISYQGYLEDNGAPVTGPVDLTIGLYDAPTGGNVVWEEDFDDTPLDSGVYSVVLGTGNPGISTLGAVDFSGPLWLDVTVDQQQISPRTALTAAPYAFRAREVARIPEPRLLGLSSYVSNGRWNFGGAKGWAAAQLACEATYPTDPNVRAFTLDEISRAIVLGNVTDDASYDGTLFWAITSSTYDPFYNPGGSNFPYPHQNNAYSLNYNSGDFARATRARVMINETINGTPGGNPGATWLEVTSGAVPSFTYAVMCGAYSYD